MTSGALPRLIVALLRDIDIEAEVETLEIRWSSAV